MSEVNEKKTTTSPNKTTLREQSKEASRLRREKENVELSELAKLLPIPDHIAKNLDKASIVKLTTSCLKIKDVLIEDYKITPFFDNNVELPFNFIDIADGFYLILDRNGEIVYISETVKLHLGLSQLELMGSNIYDYIHIADHDELKFTLSPYTNTMSDYKKEKCFFLRMRCSLPKRKAGLTHGSFKVIHFNSCLKMSIRGIPTLLAIGRCWPSSPSTQITLNMKTFMFRSQLDLKLSCMDDCSYHIGYKPKELINRSLYDYVHVYDIHPLRYTHQQLLVKGQSTSKYYRFMCKSGGYIWVQSEMSVVYKIKEKPHSIIAVNYIISDVEQKELVLSLNQEKKGDFPDESQKLPITLIDEDDRSEVSSSNLSHCNDVHTSAYFVYESLNVLGEFQNVPNGFPSDWNEQRFIQENSYYYEISRNQN